MTPLEQANALLKAAEEATPGPWEHSQSGSVYSEPEISGGDWMDWGHNGDELYVGGPSMNQRKAADAAFIALARNTAPSIALALIEKHRALEERMERLTKLTESIDALIGDSQGVYGLHMNGDPAPWSELTEGGRFEEWLIELEEARAFLARQGATA